ncbi:hypothetical protein G9C98_003204 [Cotesia typhae]|uniref:Uncharacterized protein n=1 Tax=Cotesia typhae TaxID=2053667 RepID=A0A8J5US54_9HYME|nr:hypothetical protein G9C98_003204 [Cotesia typhae]
MNRLSVSSLGNRFNNVVKKISLTPECEALSGAMTKSVLIHLGVGLVSFIVLLTVTLIQVMNQKFEELQNDMFFWSNVGTTTLSLINVVVGLWQHKAAKKIDECISTGSSL